MDESEARRWRHDYGEPITEPRVVRTGDRVLFAFPPAVGFSARFATTTGLQRYRYDATFPAASTTSIIAPVRRHRPVFRRDATPSQVRVATRPSPAGPIFVLSAILPRRPHR